MLRRRPAAVCAEVQQAIQQGQVGAGLCAVQQQAGSGRNRLLRNSVEVLAGVFEWFICSAGSQLVPGIMPVPPVWYCDIVRNLCGCQAAHSVVALVLAWSNLLLTTVW